MKKPPRSPTRKPRLEWVRVPKGPIPEKMRAALKECLEKHIAEKWEHTLAKLVLRFRGAYAYVDMQEVDSDIPFHLCRLGYVGELEHWEFAFYKYSDEVYEKSMDWEGSFFTRPETAFDIAASVYLQGG